jgi:hypothetical protein
LVIKATLAENTNRAAIWMAILVSSFILIREPRERCRDRLRILSLQCMDVLVKSRKHHSVHGSIPACAEASTGRPHHERKIKWLESPSPVRPEVSKGERDFLREHHI